MKEGKSTCIFSLMLRKFMVQYGGMGYGVKCGKIKVRCREYVVRFLYVSNISCIILEGKSFEIFPVKHSVAQGCTLSPTLINVNVLLHEIEKCSQLVRNFLKNTSSSLFCR